MSRRMWVLGAAGALAIVAVAGGVVVTSGSGHAASTVANAAANTATVQRGPLSTLVSGAGTLTYRAASDGAPVAVVNRASGTFTALPARGDKVDCGAVAYRVDERPVVLLCGAVPAYRDLHRGDGGDDVRQLNQNLQQLGVDTGIGVDPNDDHFTSRTEAALRVLQGKVGLDATGTLGIADAVFLPWAARITDVGADLGGAAQPGAVVLRVTSDTLEVQIDLDATEQEAVHPGDAARITLPGNTSTTGKIDRLGRIAKAPQGPNADGGTTIGAYLSLDHPEDARGLDKAPVQVQIKTRGVEDALSVPVTAVFGRSGGGFAVEVVRTDGRRDLVAVTLGLFDTAGGRVQVEGDVRAGDRVVVPSS